MDKTGQKKLDALRERLYDRGQKPAKRQPATLEDEPQAVKTTWREPVTPAAPPVPTTDASAVDPVVEEPVTTTGRSSYRLKLVMIGLGFFVVSILLSSLFILWGGNSISGENISISVTGPFTIGGGESLDLQIGITNQNAVPIESATLVVEYPTGTQSASEPGRELFVERLPLSNVDSGETVNIPLRAQVFGEENEELTVRASVEYRVRGSNATFYKEADPLRFKISSSPVVVSIDAVRNLSSGQETDIELTLSSNSPNPITDILVKAEYPSGFDFARSEPAPVSGQNVWSVSEIAPEGETTIVITGAVLGTQSEEHVMRFSVGVPNERDRFNLASVFATASTEFLLEEPFLDVGIDIDGLRNQTVSVAPGSQPSVAVEVENTLETTIYDAVVEIQLSGNALSDTNVQVNDGYYNSNTRIITWDISSVPGLEEMVPGDRQVFSFSLIPDGGAVATPQINIDAAVRAKRIAADRSQEQLVGTGSAVLRVESVTELTGTTFEAGRNTGPVPPVVGEQTEYDLQLAVSNGSNDITGVVVSATLPSYVEWLGRTSGTGAFEYNPVTRVVEWRPGDMAGGQAVAGSFSVAFLPSTSQVGTTPTLVGEQRLRADDRFTGSTVRADSAALTTRVGGDRDTGVVQAN